MVPRWLRRRRRTNLPLRYKIIIMYTVIVLVKYTSWPIFYEPFDTRETVTVALAATYRKSLVLLFLRSYVSGAHCTWQTALTQIMGITCIICCVYRVQYWLAARSTESARRARFFMYPKFSYSTGTRRKRLWW